jgi:hypothetical protein
MIVSINRPYFAPFPGFFYKAQFCDILVILDNIQFPRGTTWITRNRFKNDQGTMWVTIPVWKKGLGMQQIDEVRICRENNRLRKLLKSLKQAYGNAPYFTEHIQFTEKCFSTAFDKLIDLNMAIVRHLLLNFGVNTRVIRLSELNLKSRGQQLLIEICRYFDASAYVTQSAAGKHLSNHLFEKAGIEIQYLKSRTWVYPQLWGDFIADLSAFDLLFNCGPKARDIIFSDLNRIKKID